MKNINFKSIVEVICKQLVDVKAIYLFGSYASGEFSDKSDIDLALFCGNPQKSEVIFNLSLILMSMINKDIDLIDLKSVNTAFAAHIIDTGKCIYSSSENEVLFYEMNVFSQYANLQEERKDILTDILNRGNFYG